MKSWTKQWVMKRLLWAATAVVLVACSGGEKDEEKGDSSGDSSGEIEKSIAACDGKTLGGLTAGTTWQWQLTDDIDHDVDVQMYDVDLFSIDADEISELQNEGRIVICYFSAGTWEDWREDAELFADAALGKTMEEWEDEKWLDVRHRSTREMVELRLDEAVARGCNGVEPDNMDGYVNDTGFDLVAADQLNFNRFVAIEAHKRGLSVGLKNDVDQLAELEPCYDWALNEECYAFEECGQYEPFVSANKAVFHVEYVDDKLDGESLADDICGDESIDEFSTLVKDWDLTAWYRDCL